MQLWLNNIFKSQNNISQRKFTPSKFPLITNKPTQNKFSSHLLVTDKEKKKPEIEAK